MPHSRLCHDPYGLAPHAHSANRYALRDPAERIYSHYVHAVRVHTDHGIDVSGAWEEFMGVVDRAYREGYSEPAATDPEVWVRSGFYFQHLTRFRSLFPEEQLRVFLFEDLLRDAKALM